MGGERVSSMVIPFGIKAMAMGEGNKEIWAAIGNDPLTSLSLNGCDLQVTQQLASVTAIRSLTIVEAVEQQSKIGWGKVPPKTNRGGKGAPASPALGIRGGGGKPAGSPATPAAAAAQQKQRDPAKTKVTMWCGLENGNISIVDLFFLSEEFCIQNAHSGRVSLLYTAPNGRVWSSGGDRKLVIWDPTSRRMIDTKAPSRPVGEIIAVTSMNNIWTTSFENTVSVWDYDGAEIRIGALS